MTRLAEVITLRDRNARSIPDMLREAADNIETEEGEGYAATSAMVAVQLTETGEIQFYGWGAIDNMKALAMLARAQAQLCQILDEQ
jgi:hypothetical protein